MKAERELSAGGSRSARYVKLRRRAVSRSGVDVVGPFIFLT